MKDLQQEDNQTEYEKAHNLLQIHCRQFLEASRRVLLNSGYNEKYKVSVSDRRRQVSELENDLLHDQFTKKV